MTKYQPMNTAPRDGTHIMAEIPDYGCLEIKWAMGHANEPDEDRYCWVYANDDDNYPPDWAYGVCWKSNQYDEPSVQPTQWRPI